MLTIVFQISDATPIISLLIRVISNLNVNFKYLWDLVEIFFTKQLKDGDCIGDNYFSTIWILIRVISDLKVNFNYLWDLNEIFITKQLKDGEYDGYNNFQSF